MRNLIILLFIAGVVGIVMSRARQGQPDQAPAGAEAGIVRPDAGGARPTSARSLSAQAASTTHQAPIESSPREERHPAPSPAEPTRPRPEPAGAARVAAEPVEPAPAQVVLHPDVESARALIEAGRRVEARKMLTELYLGARGARAAALRQVLDEINRDLVFNPRCTEGAALYTVVPGDSLVRIGKKLGVNWRSIARLNRMDPSAVLRVGRQLKAITGRPSIVVWKGEFRMALLVDGAYVKEYAVGIGLDDRTPSGAFVIDNMVVRAPWTTPGGDVVKYGEPDYALGERWLAFEDQPGTSGLGIHGTDKEETVGTKCSNGCLRMRNPDVIELYDFVTLGTRVEIRE